MHEEATLAPDWADMRGHYHAKRMLEIAASGSHSILLVGPPLADMVVMARSLMTILPDSPFIAPSPGADPLLAAVEQARGGVLFLESLERWDDPALALLRETALQQPGQFLLVATTRYCPCGNSGDQLLQCACPDAAVESHRERLARAVDACFALEAFIPSVNSLASVCPDEPSSVVRARVAAARLLQRQRNGAARLNSALPLLEVQACSPLDMPSQKLMAAAQAQLSLSDAQTLFLMQVTRTIADLADGNAAAPGVRAQHLAEGIQYRPRWPRGELLNTVETVQPGLIGTKVGPRSTAEIEKLLREEGYDLTFDTGDNGLFVEVTWYEGRASVLVLCHNREEYSRGYESLQQLRDGQPWDLSRFDIVERTREDESGEDGML